MIIEFGTHFSFHFKQRKRFDMEICVFWDLTFLKFSSTLGESIVKYHQYDETSMFQVEDKSYLATVKAIIKN